MDKQDLLIVGLGNPGSTYEDTRHNIGFLIVDELLKAWNCSFVKEKWNGLYVSTSNNGRKVHLLKPQTFMNKSGDSAARYCNFFKISAEHVLVIHDDLDMAPGRVKLVKGGGNGGHNGIKSLVERLGTKDFYRLKIGIGRPGKGDVHADYPVEKYVLSGFSADNQELIQSRQVEIQKGIELFVAGDIAKALGVLNSLK